MADDYQTKFEELISLVPKSGAMTSANGLSKVEYYGEVHSGSPAVIKPPAGAATATPEMRMQADTLRKAAIAKMATGTFSDAPNFTTLADGLTHTKLMRNWAGGGIMTSCNAFVGYVTKKCGLSGLGGFNVEDILRAQGKSHCWIKPASGERPQYGDLFETRSMNKAGYENLHVGFSLRVDADDTWWTIEGGQGGPVMGVDRIARAKKVYRVANLLGWVDMRLLTSGKPPLPSWLIGTWMIYAGNQTYVYSVDRYGNARHKPYVSPSSQTAGGPDLDQGRIMLVAGDAAQIKWASESGVEVLRYDRWNSVGGVNERLTGTGADGSVLTGVRL